MIVLLNILILLSGIQGSNAIIGGTIVESKGIYPFMASFRNFTSHGCGAIILNEQWVLTAAHCPTIVPRENIMIIAGRLSLDETESFEQRRQVKEVYIHPEYNNTLKNDIALLKLDQAFELNAYVGKVLLPTDKNQVFDGECTVIGWGTVKFDEVSAKYMNSTYSSQLRKVNVPLWSNSDCDNIYVRIKITDSMLCAGAQGRDACQGDSGGPLVCKKNEAQQDYISGISIWGRNCGDIHPGVYTRVSYFLDWINNIITTHS
uniref:limulus clotting factor C n=1 Tax=Scolopendra dehaani TaxID=2609776 RepID=A0A076LZC5_SCODE|nr:venom serine protease precursor [Scolopendra dehaani]